MADIILEHAAEESKKFRIPLNMRLGTYIGLAHVGWMMGEYVMGYLGPNIAWHVQYSHLSLLVIFWGLAICLSYKRSYFKAQGKPYSWNNAFGNGASMSLMVAVVGAGFAWAFIHWIYPAYGTVMYDFVQQSLANQGLSPAQQASQLDWVRWLFNPPTYTVMSFFYLFIPGVLMSALLAFLVKRSAN